MTDLAQELERASTDRPTRTIYDLIERQKPELEKALGASIGAERFTRTVLTELRRTPALLECSPESLLGAMMLAAQLGLEPGPLGHVYLVPFKRQVEFIVGYRGYIDLAFRSGQVKDVAAALVREGDGFKFRRGTTPSLEHYEDGPPEDRKVIAAYAVARLRTGGAPFEVIYEKDWERARSKSPAGSKGSGPWATDTEAMIRKTAVRRLEPFLPKTPAFGRAVVVDDAPAEPFGGIGASDDE